MEVTQVQSKFEILESEKKARDRTVKHGFTTLILHGFAQLFLNYN